MRTTVMSVITFEAIAKRKGYDVVHDPKTGLLRAFKGTKLVGTYDFQKNSGSIEN